MIIDEYFIDYRNTFENQKESNEENNINDEEEKISALNLFDDDYEEEINIAKNKSNNKNQNNRSFYSGLFFLSTALFCVVYLCFCFKTHQLLNFLKQHVSFLDKFYF
ncbi:MAG: hypothetical protein LBT82_01430 [Oscillospiraceae bacterium]|jgi:hypothetical protein|nr:hypothetical protein [Oscillospiraceae bacterium]